ncbi:MAG TPA: hypothetical protein VEZ14_06140 [Dehalococcoidia bacterium]|nr:hypothetical protein [Dehalococcoidia bacterium]
MPLFRRAAKPPPPPSVPLPAGEEVDRATAALLLQGKAAIKGTLHMTNRRLVFEAKSGDARWMIVPYAEIRSAGLHRAMHAPGVRGRCLALETTKGEQVWWSFDEKAEEAWLPLVQQRAEAARAALEADEPG